MNGIWVGRWAVVLASIAAGAFGLWNLIDEIRPSWDNAVVLTYWSAWCLFPGINMLMAIFTKRPGLMWACGILALLYASFYYTYAMNGPSWKRQGAQQLHIGLVPGISAFAFLLVHTLAPLIPPMRRLINRPFQSS